MANDNKKRTNFQSDVTNNAVDAEFGIEFTIGKKHKKKPARQKED